VRLAEEIATLHALSSGRVNFGNSRGGNGHCARAFGIDDDACTAFGCLMLSSPERLASQSAPMVSTSIGPSWSIIASMAEALTGVPMAAGAVGWVVVLKVNGFIGCSLCV
jgi:hypothetical protein